MDNNDTALAGLPEAAVIIARRKNAGIPITTPAAGLALSGGGMRSATFNLGLLRGLAKAGQLHRFDYLSTVSGGGYIGAAFGRLFNPAEKAREVEAGVASEGSLWLWWLRNNGRYLAPAGARDGLIAFSSMLRGFVATQLEVAVLMLFVAWLVLLPHLLITFWRPSPLADATVFRLASGWFLVAVLPLFACAVLSWAYWFSRSNKRWSAALKETAAMACAGAAAAGMFYLAWGAYQAQLGWLAYAAIGAWLAAVPCGWLLRLPIQQRITADQRLRLTVNLGWAVAACVACGLFGLLDAASWYAVVDMNAWLNGVSPLWASTGLFGSTGLLAVAARALMPKLLDLFNQPKGPHVAVDKLANLVGIGVLLLLLCFWVLALQIFVFLCPAVAGTDDSSAPLLHAGLVLGVLVAYVLLSGANLEQVNLASMHHFYRSRLARAYVATGNSGPAVAKPRFPVSPLAAADREVIGGLHSIRNFLDNDDLPLPAYAPHRYGGPVHLINSCINQTVDDRTGSYNADRKGVALTVSALGVETGTQLPLPCPALASTTVAQWTEISGAAVSSGMGSLTSPGLAALLFLSGLRLGYWIDNLLPSAKHPAPWMRWTAKYRATKNELLASFPGLNANYWYLSDGGHFDNTGIYALLKRRLPLIVAADCGADPDYTFQDLENLIRKAKIDYNADIEFLQPASLSNHLGSDAQYFGTPATITATPGQACLLLAKVTYADRTIGSLLVVKPRMIDDRETSQPFDLVAYADRNPVFPQHSTADQFFDEAQWESYQRLGVLLGSLLDGRRLAKLQAATRHGDADTRASAVSPAAAVEAPAEGSPAMARRRRVAALQTSVGFGVSAGLAFALFQAFEPGQSKTQAEASGYEAAFEQLDTAVANPPWSVPRLWHLFGRLEATSGGLPDKTRYGKDLNYLQARLAERCGASAERSDACDLPSLLYQPARSSLYRQYWFGLEIPHSLLRRAAPASDGQALKVSEMARLQPCRSGTALYTEIYSEHERPAAVAFVEGLTSTPLRPQGIENVSQAPRAQPVPWATVMVVYQRNEDAACAGALAADYQSRYLRPARALPRPSLAGTAPPIIEVWIPPAQAQIASTLHP
ncbi:patatin-like phospholipase family protein [Pseudomonas sp. NPDC007930]|uniref:patatin-like phospholipase family protein n=1 Tax=Pseudomonas sp. NPDC007930 TaxID=3364417 RepID=UPI0036E14ABE